MSKKIKTTDGVTLVEIVDNLNNNTNTRNTKSSGHKDVNDHAPMRLTALGSTVAAVGLGTTSIVAGIDPTVPAVIGFAGVVCTLLAKGKHDSAFCVALAIINIAFTTVPIIMKLKEIGIFDWLSYNM